MCFFPEQVSLHLMQFLYDCQSYINTGLGYDEQVVQFMVKDLDIYQNLKKNKKQYHHFQ